MNCGRSAPDSRYCPDCGQERREPVPSVKDLLRHLFDDVFSMDSKIARTLVTLVRSPGRLTVEYLGGRQVHYVRPLRLYVVLSLVFFVLLAWFGDNKFVFNTSGDLEVADLESAEAPAPADSLDFASTTEVERALRAARFDEPIRRTLRREFSRGALDSTWIAAVSPRDTTTAGDFSSLRGVPLVGARLARQAERLATMEGETFTDMMNASIVRNLPKGVFLLVPVFALLLKLVYLRRQRRYTEHFVFALHVHSFAFLAFSVLVLVPWKAVDLAIVALLWIYVLVAMKRVYQQGKFKTFVKFLGLFFGYVLLLVLTLLGTAVVSALTL